MMRHPRSPSRAEQFGPAVPGGALQGAAFLINFSTKFFPLAFSVREKWNFYFEEEGVGNWYLFSRRDLELIFIFDTFTAIHLMKM